VQDLVVRLINIIATVSSDNMVQQLPAPSDSDETERYRRAPEQELAREREREKEGEQTCKTQEGCRASGQSVREVDFRPSTNDEMGLNMKHNPCVPHNVGTKG
jgi:hypothetical protein